MMKTFKYSAGFTLIELVIVIVILGVLAVTAAPRFIDLSEDATNAATQGQMGAFRSGITLLQAKYQIRQTTPINIGGQSVDFTPDGWAQGSTADTAGCVDLWNKVYSSPEPVNALASYNSPLVTGWNAYYYSGACGYILGNAGEVFYDDTGNPTQVHFVYFTQDLTVSTYSGNAGDVKMYNL